MRTDPQNRRKTTMTFLCDLFSYVRTHFLHVRGAHPPKNSILPNNGVSKNCPTIFFDQGRRKFCVFVVVPRRNRTSCTETNENVRIAIMARPKKTVCTAGSDRGHSFFMLFRFLNMCPIVFFIRPLLCNKYSPHRQIFQSDFYYFRC